jgi:hypothetical protein
MTLRGIKRLKKKQFFTHGENEKNKNKAKRR